MGITLEEVEKRLFAERERVQGEIAAASEAQRASVSEESATRLEDGSETFDEELRITLRADLEQLLSEIQHALHKIEQGSYGTCDSCGQAIPLERLEILPHSALCVHCKQLDEHLHQRTHQPA